MENKASRKIHLTATIVKERLSFHRIPRANDKGQIVDFDPNTDEKRYVIFDSHGDAPVGFGVAVNRTNMSYILQRRVGARVLKATIGNVRDIPLVQARQEALKALEEMRATMQSPAEARQALEDDIRVEDMTLAGCIALYRKHLIGRNDKPAKESTLRGLAQAELRLGRKGVDLINLKIGTLVSGQAILDAFDFLASGSLNCLSAATCIQQVSGFACFGRICQAAQMSYWHGGRLLYLCTGASGMAMRVARCSAFQRHGPNSGPTRSREMHSVMGQPYGSC